MSRFCISVACDLKENTPQQVVDILSHMVGLQRIEFKVLPSHRFFEDEYWETLLNDTQLLRFPGEGGAALRRVSRYDRPMSGGGDPVFFYTFSFRCEDRDDGITNFLIFLDWLAPNSQTQGFVGYWQYEYDEHPQLLYVQGDSLLFPRIMSRQRLSIGPQCSWLLAVTEMEIPLVAAPHVELFRFDSRAQSVDPTS
jgi:hypothetical protein